MDKRVGDFEGRTQGKCYRIWQIGEDLNTATFQVEKVWGAGVDGVIFESSCSGLKGYDEAKMFLKGIGAKRLK